MVDQTRWGIDMVQQENKAKAYEDQKLMRKEVEEFIKNCNVYQLQKMTERMKQLKNENSNTQR
jgi:UDP-N-acetylglucosamine:LPS N-acetylglucosamine transferase